MQLADAPADEGDPGELALQHPHLSWEYHRHGDRFPGRGMLPQGHVIVGGQVLAPLNSVVEAASPLQRGKQYGSPDTCERKAQSEGQEEVGDDEKDRVEKRPEKKEEGEEEGADELHASHQPG